MKEYKVMKDVAVSCEDKKGIEWAEKTLKAFGINFNDYNPYGDSLVLMLDSNDNDYWYSDVNYSTLFLDLSTLSGRMSFLEAVGVKDGDILVGEWEYLGSNKIDIKYSNKYDDSNCSQYIDIHGDFYDSFERYCLQDIIFRPATKDEIFDFECKHQGLNDRSSFFKAVTYNQDITLRLKESQEAFDKLMSEHIELKRKLKELSDD